MKKFKKIGIISVNVLLVAAVALCLWLCHSHSQTLLSQRAAEYWQGESETRFGQVSCFFPVTKEAGINDIFSFRAGIESKLNDAGMETQEEQSVWADAYSAFATLTVSGEKGSSEVDAVGVGGDFFLFHPYELLSGSYINGDDLMKDRVVLDYDLAWKLFGSASLDGLSVTINGKPYYIAGVVRRETDKFTARTIPEDAPPMMFMSYEALTELFPETGLSSYELVTANPISGFARQMVEDGFKDSDAMVVENSARYDFTSIWSIFSDFGSRSVIDKGVVLPYWENAARVSEVYIARLWVIMAVLGLFPLICLIWLAVKLIRFICSKLKKGGAAAKEAWDDRYGRMEELKEKKAAKKARKGRAPREKKPRSAKAPRSPAPPKEPSPPEEPPVYDEKAVAMDVESIVREIMEEEQK